MGFYLPSNGKNCQEIYKTVKIVIARFEANPIGTPELFGRAWSNKSVVAKIHWQFVPL